MKIPGFPVLWFPPLTFYREGGEIDYERMTAQMKKIRPFCKGILVPGCTGDGWVLEREKLEDLVRFFLKSPGFDLFDIMIGALLPTADETLASIERWCGILRDVSGKADNKEAMDTLGVKAFVFCVPAGEKDPQRQKQEMGRILGTGLPMAFYQLPLVTGVTVAPEVIADLAGTYNNLVAAKDSGGKDELAESGLLKDRLMLFRGAEGDPTEMILGSAPIYDGLLLSTVNCFAEEYCGMLQGKCAYMDFGAVIGEVFAQVQTPVSNAFSDAVRAICHVQEYGDTAWEIPCRCYNGETLSVDLIKKVNELITGGKRC